MQPIIRLANESDAAQVLAIYTPSILDSVISFELDVPPVPEIAHRMGTTLERYPWLVCENEGMVVGYAYAGTHGPRAAYQWSVDVSVYIDSAVHRKGVGRGLYESLLGLLKLQGFHRAFADITLPNPGSVGLHESLGFEQLGIYREVGFKFGKWHDVGWWQLSLRAKEGPPELPTYLPHVIPSVEWEMAMNEGLTEIRI
jgi:phosphinothricin acetyltransferase